MAKQLSTKKAAEAAAEEEVQEKSTYITLEQIPWDTLSEYGIRKEDFLGDSKMNKGRRDALLSGNWTPTFEAHKTMNGIHFEQTFSMRANKMRHEDGSEEITLSLETPLHEDQACEYRIGQTDLPDDVRSNLAAYGSAGRVVQIEERVFENGRPKPELNRTDQYDPKTGELIARAGEQRINPETGKGMWETRRNSYFLSLNPFTRRIQKRMATRELKEGIRFPEFYNYVNPPTDRQIEALRSGDAVVMTCRSERTGNFVARCLQYNAASGLVEHNDRHPFLASAIEQIKVMNAMINPKEDESQKQSSSLKI